MSLDNLPRWQSHKVVRAAKIIGRTDDGRLGLDTGGEIVYARVDDDFRRRWPDAHMGGYLIVYPDGYVSWSPAASFEGGYTRIAEGS